MIKRSIISIVKNSSFLQIKIWKLLESSYKNNQVKTFEDESQFLLTLSKFYDSPLIIDVGANTGKWSELAKAIMPKSTIYAIEPIQQFFDQIKSKIVYKKHNIALSHEEGFLSIFKSKGGGKSGYKKGSVEHRVPCLSGDVFVSKNIKNPVDFIKIDTDGFDYDVIVSFDKTIEKYRPVVQFEVSHWWLQRGFTLTLAIRYFTEKNYICMVLKDGKLGEINSVMPKYLFSTANLVAMPKENFNIIKDLW